MYRKGLILTGLVGGMVMFGGSALAAMPTAHAETASYGDPDDNRFQLCGDNPIWTKGDVNVYNTKSGIVLDLKDILNILGGDRTEDEKCVIS